MNKLKVLNSNLKVNKISKSFGNKQVVRNISLNIKVNVVIDQYDTSIGIVSEILWHESKK